MLVTPENLQDVVAHLSTRDHLGLDTETTGLYWQDRLFSVVIADEADSYYFNFQPYPNGGTVLCDNVTVLQSIFRETTCFYISNAKFDMRMLRHSGIACRGIYFCLTAQGRVLKNNYFGGKAYSLAAWGERLGDSKDDAVEEYIKKNKLYDLARIPGKSKIDKLKRFKEVPLEIIQPYAEQDAKLHLKVGLYIRDQINALNNPTQGQPKDIMHNEMALTKICHEMEWVGIKINRAYVTEAQAFEQREVDRYKREFYDISGGRSFIDSNKALDEAFRACGYDEIPVTEKGNPSFTDAALEGLGGKLAECVRCIRHHEKRIGTYYSSFLHYAGADDVIHPNMKQGGTETGRFSYSEPNLQNVPKEEHAEDGHPSIVRRSFVPRDGKCFVMIDYKQQEYRLMLDYAGETQLIAEVNAGADVHQAMADMVGITRQQAKTLNFAVLYGASSAKIAGMLKIGNAEATHLLNLYYSKLPRVKAFKNAVIKRGEMRGYIINWAGRRCHIDRRDWAYVLPNHLIQGGGADVIKFAMVKIAALLEGTKSAMTLQIHDELLIAMDPDDFHLIPKVQQIMESVYPAQNGIVLATSVSHSFKSWGAPDVVEGLPI